MYSITYLYSTWIRGKGVSLKNTELYLPVRSWAQKGVGLIEGGRLVALQEFLIREGSKWSEIRKLKMTPLAPRPFPHLYNSARESSLEAVSIQDFYEFMLSLETVFFLLNTISWTSSVAVMIALVWFRRLFSVLFFSTQLNTMPFVRLCLK